MVAAFAVALPVAAYPGKGAAQDKPKIANDVEPTSTVPAKGKASKARTQTSPSRPAPAPIEVTFKSDPPGAEIFLNRGGVMESLGKTDAEGKLVYRLPRGRHLVTASRTGARIVRQQIDVKPGTTDFTFDLNLPAAPETDKVAQAEPVATDTSAEIDKPAPPTIVPEEVIKRFLDAQDPNAVTLEEWKQTQELSRQAADREPGHKQLAARAHFTEGQVAYVGGDFATALVLFNKSVLASPDYVPAQISLGNAYLATKQPVEAFRAYQRAAELDQKLAIAYVGMGNALSKQGRTREAASYYERAKSFGQSLPTSTNLAAARDLKRRKRWAQAVKEFEDVVKVEPSADVFVEIGDCYEQMEQPLSAARAYQKATELDPKAALAHFKYAELMFKLNEFGPALEAYESALALDTTGDSIDRSRARDRANEAARKLGLKRGK
jgi:tetratricopeptide (TPR) repeat protein